MRDYAKLSNKFWAGETCKELRRRGFEGPYVALYLMSAPGSNMIGIYYQPIMYMAHETGLGLEGASKGLQYCIESGFCQYDYDKEIVWVVEMAKYQIAAELKASDKQCKGVQRQYDALPPNQFLPAFFDKYQTAFHMSSKRNSEGASMPLRSQEQEQEQEQEQKPTLPGADISTEVDITTGEVLAGGWK